MFGIYLGFICVRPENQNHVTSDQWQNSAYNSAENTPNAPKFISPICLSKPKSLGYHWKKASSGIRSQYEKLLRANYKKKVKKRHNDLEYIEMSST